MKLTIYKNDINSSSMETALNHEFGVEKVKSKDIEFLGFVVWCNDKLGYFSQPKKGKEKEFDSNFESALVFKNKQVAINALLESSKNGSVCVSYIEDGTRSIVVLIDSSDFKKQVCY